MSFQKLVELMNILRGEGGCPWDREQTLDSLKPFLIEETYEVIEAIERNDPEKLKEELGDLLFHILFMSKVCADTGRFDIGEVIDFECKKMTRRHPHVFGGQTVAAKHPPATRAEEALPGRQLQKPAPDAPGTKQGVPALSPPSSSPSTLELTDSVSRAGMPGGGTSAQGTSGQTGRPTSSPDPAQVLRQWYEMKREERARKGIQSLMDGIPRHLPALQKAQKVQRRAGEVGFDWENPKDVLNKIAEEIDELRSEISQSRKEQLSDEIGDILFSVVNLSRFLEVDAEGALRGTISKFIARFKTMEQEAAASGKTLDGFSLEEMDAMWEAIKAKEKGAP